MPTHPCQHRHAPDAACRQPPSFRCRDAGKNERKHAERLEAVRQDAPRYFATFRRAYGGKSLRAAVDAFCCECQGFDAAAVRNCTAPACPLYSQEFGGT